MDIAVTWPKTRPLGSYYAELENARRDRLDINFRIPMCPRQRPERCYMVYDGQVRCWTAIKDILWRGTLTVRDPITGNFWPPGYYIVRSPRYHEIQPVPMKGFQGFRYINREEVEPHA
jgi:hypothetical protein